MNANLLFEEWTSAFGSQRLNGALLDGLTQRVHILESYRLKHQPTSTG